MTRIAIVGGGHAATLHAEAALATPGVELVGVGGRPGSARALADATGVPDLSLANLVERSDGLVIAIPSAQAADLLFRLDRRVAVLVESPVLIDAAPDDPVTAMTAVNLLHADLVKRGLRAIGELGGVHHLVLRGRAVPRPHMTDVIAEPFAGAWPILLAAAGRAATRVTATADATHARVTLDLADGSQASAELEWIDPDTTTDALTELEAAGAAGVVNIGLWPQPTLEIDGRAVGTGDAHPLVALGFVEQMRRFAAVCDRRAEPWPPLSVGQGVTTLIRSARRSAERGETVTVG